MKKYYAIGLTKEWVQLRIADKPPNAHKSEVVKAIKERVEDFDYYHSYYRPPKFKTLSRDFKLSVTYHVGGKVLCTVKAGKFRQLTYLRLKVGEMRELTDVKAKRVLEHKGLS